MQLTSLEFQYSFVINDVFIYLLHNDIARDILGERETRLMCQDMR